MELDTLFELFGTDEEEGSFEDVDPKLNPNEFMHVMLRVQELVGLESGVPLHEGHDQLWIRCDMEKLAEVATPELITELRRCGVFYDDGLSVWT